MTTVPEPQQYHDRQNLDAHVVAGHAVPKVTTMGHATMLTATAAAAARRCSRDGIVGVDDIDPAHPAGLGKHPRQQAEQLPDARRACA